MEQAIYLRKKLRELEKKTEKKLLERAQFLQRIIVVYDDVINALPAEQRVAFSHAVNDRWNELATELGHEMRDETITPTVQE